MMDETQPKGTEDLTGTNATYVKIDRLAPMVDFTLQNGTNRPASVQDTTRRHWAWAMGYFPATQLTLSHPEMKML